MNAITNGAAAISEEVRAAVSDGKPIVALESTIFTHGLPQPRNREVAIEAEGILRGLGVVPATIGVVDGAPTIGLSEDQIIRLSADESAVKVSQRDLPVVAAKRLNGGTTVAATAFLAHLAGIRVFATGGLGGVHHGASESFDESADLTTLSSVPVLMVSAGVKSILDIPATLERLETLNVTVAGYRTTTYPGFYVADSGSTVEYAIDTPEEAARILAARDSLGLRSAVLIANPIPENRQLDPVRHASVLAEAWEAAAAEGISGNATTPFLLEYIEHATNGESLRVNIDVYRGNVTLGARIAGALSQLGSDSAR